jgi:hypothetical protein
MTVIYILTLASALTVRRSLVIFSMYEFIHHRSVFGDYDHYKSKRAPKYKNVISSKTTSETLIKFQ